MEKQLQLSPNSCAAGRVGWLLQRARLCPAPETLTLLRLEHVEVPLPSRITCCCCGAVACKKFN